MRTSSTVFGLSSASGLASFRAPPPLKCCPTSRESHGDALSAFSLDDGEDRGGRADADGKRDRCEQRDAGRRFPGGPGFCCATHCRISSNRFTAATERWTAAHP